MTEQELDKQIELIKKIAKRRIYTKEFIADTIMDVINNPQNEEYLIKLAILAHDLKNSESELL